MHHNELKVRRLGIDTYHEPVAFMHVDCAVCRAEGFRSMSRIHVACRERSVIATLNVVLGDMLGHDEIGLSEAAWNTLGADSGEAVVISHPEPVESFSAVRNKIYGGTFSGEALQAVIRDVTVGRYASIEIAALITACAGPRMSIAETVALTRAMVDSGTRLSWPHHPVVDKHCVGGLPGNRTTPVVVAIVAACGLTIPKTSSRAITSPAGTADAMEVLAPVDLTLEHMRRVVEREGGCVVWGGSMALSPADDILIQVERPLDFDSVAQLTASILSKKLAAGSTDLLIDIPVGETAKVRDAASAAILRNSLLEAGGVLGLNLRAICSDGSQPVGRGIGPALEARDVLAVLRGSAGYPVDLRERSLDLAGELLELGGGAEPGAGRPLAQTVLDSGAAWRKFQSICMAQGGLREPGVAPHRRNICAARGGIVRRVDNRRLSRVAKLAGAPAAPMAGVELLVKLGQRPDAREPLYVIHAETPGELEYAAAYAASHPDIIGIEGIA